MEENPGTETTIFIYCIAKYALYRVINCIQSENNLFGNPDWYMEWLGTVDRR